MRLRSDLLQELEKEEDLAYDYNVEAYPTFYVVFKNGIREIPQYSNPQSFIMAAKEAGLE